MPDLREDANAISRLFGDAFEQLSTLLRTELQLAKAEISEKARLASLGAGLVAAGALICIPAVVVLLTALALVLVTWGMAPALSYLIASVVGFAVSAILIMVGLQHLKPEALVPRQTLRQVEKDAALAKEIAS